MTSVRLENAARLYLETRLAGNVRQSVEQYTGDTFKQHSTGVSDGVEGYVGYYSKFIEIYTQRDIRIIRAIDGRDFVFLHCYHNLNPGGVQLATAEFFRFDEQDRVVEHWDVVGPYSTKNPSEHTSLDGPVKIEDNHLTEDNRFIVLDMVKNVLRPGGDVTKMYSYISDVEFTQHNSQTPDGIANFEPLVMSKEAPFEYEDVILSAAQGNFVSILSKVRWNNQLFSKADIFRLSNRKIVEHWDVIEKVVEYDVNSGKF